MNIIWSPNPLATVVELDKFDKKLLRLKLEVEDLRERVVTAFFDLNPKDREWHNKHVKERSLEDAVNAALRVLRPDSKEEEEEEDLLDKKLNDYSAELTREHYGDCTCEPCSCLKCHAEELVEVDTVTGLDKHAGAYIQNAFLPKLKDGLAPTLEQAIESLRDYRPVKGPAWDKFSDEEFQRHIPRWTKEAERAHQWLVAYKKEHF